MHKPTSTLFLFLAMLSIAYGQLSNSKLAAFKPGDHLILGAGTDANGDFKYIYSGNDERKVHLSARSSGAKLEIVEISETGNDSSGVKTLISGWIENNAVAEDAKAAYRNYCANMNMTLANLENELQNLKEEFALNEKNYAPIIKQTREAEIKDKEKVISNFRVSSENHKRSRASEANLEILKVEIEAAAASGEVIK